MHTVLLAIFITVFSIEVDTASGVPERPLKVDLKYGVNAMGVDFWIEAPNQRLLRVNIRDQDRDLIFQRTFHGASLYKGTLNFESMTDGTYYIEVRQNQHKVVKQVQLSRTSLRTVSLK